MIQSWDRLPLADFAKTGSGGTPNRSESRFYEGGSIPWVKSGELRRFRILDTEEKITPEALASSSAKLVPKGAILIALYGATVGQCSILEIEAATNQAVCFIVPNPKICKSRFLYYFLLSIKDYLLSQRAGGAQPNISQALIKNLEIPLPPLPEQDRIIEILDQADALRQQRRQADELSQRILPALFHEMFGDLRLNPNGWKVTDLGDLAEIVSGITKGRRTNESDLREVAYLSVANVQDGHLRLENIKRIEASAAEIIRYRLLPDDLVLTEGGDPDKLGRGALWSGEITECIHQNHIFRVRTISPLILPSFLAVLTASEYGKAYFFSVAKKTTGIASINKRQLSAFPVVIPPLELQSKFANYLSILNKNSDDQASSAATLETLFQTLLHRAFDGSLTAKWREGEGKELLQEMTHQAKV